jgi:excisionase family DNA binding protein
MSAKKRVPSSRRDRGRHTTINQIPTDGFLGRLEAAEFTALSVQTLDAMIKQGKLRAYQVGRRVLVCKQDLIAAVTVREL